MKKINKALILIIAIISFFTVLFELDKGVVIVLKDGSIILTLILPYIFEKIFKKDLSEGFKLVWIIFIFMAHYLGVICCLYSSWPFFDKIVHTMSGILTAYVAMIILKDLKISKKGFSVLFIIAFSALCALSWEIFEFTCNILVGGDAQLVAKTGVNDTMLDMIVALGGSILYSICYFKKSGA